MDVHVKAGEVYLQPRKIGKKWNQVWLALYPASLCSMGRLEISDVGSSWAGAGVGGEMPGTSLGGEPKRYHQGHKARKLKVVRLSDIISVRKLPPHAEALPKVIQTGWTSGCSTPEDRTGLLTRFCLCSEHFESHHFTTDSRDNMAAFCVKTAERNLVFAAMKDEGAVWVERLCQVAFQNPRVCGPRSKHEMEDNQIYTSADAAGGFLVVVQKTDAAARCGLQGAYRLLVGQDALSLTESENSRIIWSWSYRHLRRYGNDHLALTIEAGRRCDSGPGTFTFETGQASVLFGLIENAIKHQKSSTAFSSNSLTIHTVSQTPAGVATLPSRLPHSPLPKIPDMTSIPTILENSLKIKSTTLTASEESLYAQPADLISASECVYAQPLDKIIPIKASAPISCLTFSEDQSIDGIGSMEDSVSNTHLGVTSEYVDPATFLPLKPPTASSPSEAPGPSVQPSSVASTYNADHSEPIYSEVYDKLSPGQRGAHLTQNQKRTMDNEPIYDEPVRETEGAAKQNEDKQDPFAHLYAEVCKLTPTTEKTVSFSSSGAAGTTMINSSDEALPDVIYETLGII